VKVYVVTSGEYSDYHIVRIFLNQADANAYQLGDDVSEWDVAEGPVEVRNWYQLCWWPHRPDAEGRDDPNPWWRNESRDFDDNERACTHRWHEAPGTDRFTSLTIQGWDRERILKVYSEQRAQYLALGRIPTSATEGTT
jgi:hypothetical protein